MTKAVFVIACFALLRTALLIQVVWNDCIDNHNLWRTNISLLKHQPDDRINNKQSRPSNASTTLCHSSIIASPLSPLRNGAWHYFVDINQTEYMIYSAFYDDRPDVGPLPMIRLLVVASTTNISLFCQIWYVGESVPYIIATEELRAGRGDKINGTFYSQKTLSCRLTHALYPPHAVSLVEKPCDNATILVPITSSPYLSHFPHQFGICVAISFGSIDPVQLVEWVEFHRMFGVTEFNVYNSTLLSNKALEYYRNLGVLRIFQMQPPVNDFTKKGVKLSSPASLNDCMLRNMYRYQYMLTIDFDEFIVPKMASSYDMLLRQIDRVKRLQEPWISYTIRNVFFFSEFGVNRQAPAHLRTSRYHWRVATSRYLHASKSFVNPRRCLSVFNHFCLIRFASAPAKGWSVDVSETLATCHHYRTCAYDKKRCQELFATKYIDDTMARYRSQLDQRIIDVFKHINAIR